MGGVGFREILVILIIVILLFGSKKIPELMRGMGSGIKEFKNAVKDEEKTEYVNRDTQSRTDSTADRTDIK